MKSLQRGDRVVATLGLFNVRPARVTNIKERRIRGRLYEIEYLTYLSDVKIRWYRRTWVRRCRLRKATL